MKRSLALLAGAITGAATAAVVFRRRLRQAPVQAGPDPRAEDLRRKLAEAREAAVEEDDFAAAGMGPETVIEDEPPAPRPVEPKSPGDEFEAMRRRVHEEARAAAEEMRKESGQDDRP